MTETLTDAAVRERFAGAADLVRRTVRAGDTLLYIYFIDGLTAASDIAGWVLRPLAGLSGETAEELYQSAREGGLWAATVEPAQDLTALTTALLNGSCVILFPQGRALAVEAKSNQTRSISQPQVEATVKGAKDAFNEVLRTNTSLVRRHLRTPELCLHQIQVGRRSGTAATVVWIRDLTNPRLPQELIKRLEGVDVDGLLTPAAVEQYVTGAPATAFPLLLYTERPDKFAQGLLEGRVGLLVDGLPLGYLAPASLSRFLASPEDRSVGFVTAAALRGLRYAAFLAGLLLPGLYIAMASFHQEMIPTPLLLAVIESKQSVPFPTAVEVVGLLISFELLQEAGLHLPQSIGQSVSIIGGLVVGTAAVEARLVSPAALIVVAAAGICGFTLPDQDLADAVRLWRAVLALAASASGLFGLTVGALGLTIHLAGLECLGVWYLAPFARGLAAGRILPGRLRDRKYRTADLHPLDRRNQI